MSFTRTHSGISNLYLFHGVDLIVFTEGGEISHDFDGVVKGKFNSVSIDVKFWSLIFKKHGFSKKVQFRALGSKNSLQKLCDLLCRGEISNVAVAKDSDLDDFLSVKVESPYVLYTRGYSWENDVYSVDQVLKQVESLILESVIDEETKKEVKGYYKEFERYAKRLIKIEIMSRKNGVRFITGLNGERLLGSGKPGIRSDQLKSALDVVKGVVARPVYLSGKEEVCIYKHTYGKLLESFAISVISYVVRRLTGGKSFPKQIISLTMLERYGKEICEVTDDYYRNLVGALNKA